MAESTNDIESVWAVLKRGVYGVYHHVDAKHLGRYVDEFTFRLNDGNVKRQDIANALGWTTEQVSAARIKLKRRLLSKFPETFATVAKEPTS